MSIGKRIKLVRDYKNISQTDLASAVHISKQTLWKYENDIIDNIPSDVIESIARYLCVSPSFLMGWSDGFYISSGENAGYYYVYDDDCTDVPAPAPDTESLTDHEKAVITAYRAKPEMQMAVDTLLGVSSAPTIESDIGRTVAMGESVLGKSRTDTK